MKYCCFCGTALPDNAAFCSACGKAVDPPAAPVAAPEVSRRGAPFSALSLSFGVMGMFMLFALATFIAYEMEPLVVLISCLLSVSSFMLAVIFSLKSRGERPRALGLVGRFMGFGGMAMTGICLLSSLLPHLLNL